jgi:hypothetical protein
VLGTDDDAVEHEARRQHRGHLHLDDVDLTPEQSLGRDLEPWTDGVIDDAGGRVVDERQERREQRRVGAGLVRRRDGGRDQLGIVEQTPWRGGQLGEVSRFSVERVIERCGDLVRLRPPRV